MFLGKENLGWNTLVSQKVDGDNSGNVEHVMCVGFDDFFNAELKLDRVDFVKIDVEGHEHKVLEGMMDTLRRFMPIIFTEIAWGKDENPDWDREKEVFQKLFDMGYAPHDLDKITCTRDIILRPARKGN